MNDISKRVIKKRFETPDEIREFNNGRFESLHLNSCMVGRAVYQPGWRWSTDVGAAKAQAWCQVEHVVMVLSGCLAALMEDGSEITMHPGDVLYIPPGHDSWVVGNDPFVSLHLLGSDEYSNAIQT